MLREDLVVRWVDGDLVIYDPITDRTALLNPSAAVVLGLCDGTRDPGQIVDAVQENYPHSEQDVATDVETVLAQFLDQRILVESSAERGNH